MVRTVNIKSSFYGIRKGREDIKRMFRKERPSSYVV